jgi:dihydroorotase-like cyclic amidohydrolase
MTILLKNAQIVNEGNIIKGHILIENEIINKIFDEQDDINSLTNTAEIIDLKNKHVFPGVIDDQVHFREPIKQIFIRNQKLLLPVVLPLLWKCRILFQIHLLKNY